MIAHALRLREGLPIYAEPSLDFIPFFYTPAYPQVLAWLDNCGIPISFASARGLSIISSLGVLSLIYGVIWRECHSHPRAILGMGIFAALFRTCGAFYDLARPDSLMLLFVAAAITLGQQASSIGRVCCAAFMMSAAFFTKQTAAVFFPVIGLWLLWTHFKRGLLYISLTLILCSAGVWWLNLETHGWFWTYIFEGHQGHVFLWHNILLKYWRDLLFLAPITLLLPLLWLSRSPFKALSILLALHWIAALVQRILTLDYPPHMYYRELFYESPRWLIVIPPVLIMFLLGISRRGRQAEPLSMSLYWLWIFIAGVGASGLNHSTQWAYSNCFMPLALSCSFALPLMLNDLLSSPRKSTHLIRIALGFQLFAWAYIPSAQIPQEDDYNAWRALNQRLAAFSAPLFFPGHPTYNALDRQLRGDASVHTHQMGIRDVAYRGGVTGLKAHLSPQRGAHRWPAVILNDRVHLPFLQDYYYEAERFFTKSDNTLRAKTGFLTRPSSLWVPRRQGEPARWLNGAVIRGRSPLRISANFEDTASTTDPSTLGWTTEGAAFSRPITCNPEWRGEGRCGIWSGPASAKGELSTKLTLPYDAHLSLLIRTRSLSQSPSTLELRIEQMTGDGHTRALRRMRLHTQNQWARFNLILPPTQEQSSRSIKLSVIDQDDKSQVWVDDLRLLYPLDL